MRVTVVDKPTSKPSTKGKGVRLNYRSATTDAT